LRPCAVTRTQNFQEKIIVLPLSYEFRADRYPPRARSKPADLRTPARQSRASTRAPTTPQEMRQTPTTEERRRPRAPHLPPLLFCLLHRRRSNCHGPRSLPFHPRAHRHLPRRARGREGRERSPLPFPLWIGDESLRETQQPPCDDAFLLGLEGRPPVVDWTRAGDKTHETSAPSPCRFREVVSWSAPMHSSGLQSRLLGFDSGRGGLARFGVARRGRLLPVSTAGSVRSVGARVTSWRVPSLVQIGRGQRAVGHVLPFRFPSGFSAGA
jgi:hypothetical protein